MVPEKALKCLLDSKEIKSVNPKGNQPWLVIGRTDAEPEAPILDHLMWRDDSWKRSWCWERLRIGGERGDRISWMDGITDSVDMSLSKLWEIVKGRESWRAVVYGMTKNWTRLSDWATSHVYLWRIHFDIWQN